ncbi:MAG: hypothetical protein IH961_03300 [Chloroflexi bacterium]|nr:hypothetical protein [Chloroflexota bacterium]
MGPGAAGWLAQNGAAAKERPVFVSGFPKHAREAARGTQDAVSATDVSLYFQPILEIIRVGFDLSFQLPGDDSVAEPEEPAAL